MIVPWRVGQILKRAAERLAVIEVKAHDSHVGLIKPPPIVYRLDCLFIWSRFGIL